MTRLILFLLISPLTSITAQVSMKETLSPPLGLRFGMTQGQADKIMIEQGGIVNTKASLSGARLYEDVEIGNYYSKMVLFFRISKLVKITATINDSENGRRIYEQIRQNVVLKYGVPTLERRFDEEIYSASTIWLFNNGTITLHVSRKEVDIEYSDAVKIDEQAEKARRSF